MTDPSAFSAVLGWAIVVVALYVAARVICALAGDTWSDQ